MKFSAALSLVATSLAFTTALQNRYPLRQRSNHLIRGGLLLDDSISISDQGSSGSTQVIVIWANPGNGASTTTVNSKVTVTQTVTASATPVSSGAGGLQAIATHQVTVGGDAGLVYSPPSIKAAVGDMVVFTFMSMNHTATQSGFDTPCDRLAGGLDTGFQPNPDNTVNPPPQVAMQVMTTDPLWFYCAQTGHCGQGMVFSINPTASKSQQAFVNNALATVGGTSGSTNPSSSNGSSSAAPPAASPSSVQSGQGSLQSGVCTCAVTCSAGTFPAAVQGTGAFGGFAGSLPAGMAVGA